jgi:hypothetical protein
MKTKKNEKVALLLMAIYMLNTLNIFAASDAIGTAYSIYIRPILISIVVLTFIVTSLFHIGDFRKGGDAAKDAFIHCVMMAVYPGAVLALAEAVKAIMAMFATTL